MRRIPHPVVLITACQPEPDSSLESTFRGMTVSSFNSVALDPTPLVSLNMRLPSATHTALVQTGTFLAHFLSATDAGAAIAHAFARPRDTQLDAFRDVLDGNAVQIFAGKGSQGAPLLAGSGIMRVLRCKALPGKEVVVGDHVVLVAEVLGIVASVGSAQVDAKKMGLVYGDGEYREVGAAISAESQTLSGDTVQSTMGLNVRRGDEQIAPQQ